MSPRRELWLAVGLCLVGSALTLWSVRQPWAYRLASEGLTIRPVRSPVRGSAVAAPAQALAVVGVAGVLAVAATRRSGRVVVGVLLALAGALAAADVSSLLGDLHGRLARAGGAAGPQVVSAEQYDAAAPHWAWPVLALLGSLLLAAGGVLVAWRGRRWAALSAAYEAPAAREVAAEPSAKATWDLLDSGEDPTA